MQSEGCSTEETATAQGSWLEQCRVLTADLREYQRTTTKTWEYHDRFYKLAEQLDL